MKSPIDWVKDNFAGTLCSSFLAIFLSSCLFTLFLVSKMYVLFFAFFGIFIASVSFGIFVLVLMCMEDARKNREAENERIRKQKSFSPGK